MEYTCTCRDVVKSEGDKIKMVCTHCADACTCISLSLLACNVNHSVWIAASLVI